MDRCPSYQLRKANDIVLFDDHPTLVPTTNTAYLRIGADTTCFQISTYPIFTKPGRSSPPVSSPPSCIVSLRNVIDEVRSADLIQQSPRSISSLFSFPPSHSLSSLFPHFLPSLHASSFTAVKSMVRPRVRPLVSLFNSPPTSFVTPSSPSSKEEDADAALGRRGRG